MITRHSMLEMTTDVFKAAYLERMINRTTNSYKLYWFKAVFDEVINGANQADFKRLSARMVESAWYPVNYFRLSLGHQDQLGRAVALCGERLRLDMDARSNEIIRAVEHSRDEEVRTCVDDLCRYVPYRLIRVFYEDNYKLQGLPDQKVNATVFEINRHDPLGCIYVLNEDATGLEVQPEWAAYLRDNRHIVQGWLDMRLVEYLQARNPSVPAISLKIHRPLQRDTMNAERTYWRTAIERVPMREIYTGEAFGPEAYDRLGPLSLDHFVPWSFVLHNEIWNLVPVFRNVNSSKGDRLPDLDGFLPALCDQQFDALMANRDRLGARSPILASYLQVDPDVASYENRPACRRRFSERLSGTIRPLHQIARNQGFPLWRADEAAGR